MDTIVEGVQGGKLEFEIALTDEDGRPIDTTAYDQFKVCIRIDSTTVLEVSHVANANGSVMTKSGNAAAGVFLVSVTPLDVALLPARSNQDVDFEMSEAANVANIVREVFENQLSIRATSCS